MDKKDLEIIIADINMFYEFARRDLAKQNYGNVVDGAQILLIKLQGFLSTSEVKE